MQFATLAALGLLAGALIGATGVGAGSLMTPMLIGVFRLPLPAAIGTDLWFAGITKAGGALAHWRHGQVERGVVLRMLLGSLPASALTLLAMHALGLDKTSLRVLGTALGVALLLTALLVACRGPCLALAQLLQQRLSPASRERLDLALGGLLGVLVTLSSVGAGAIGSTCIAVLHPRLPARRLVGTDIAHAVPLTLLAGVGHAALGDVRWPVLGALLVGSVPGIWLGARASRMLPERVSRALEQGAMMTPDALAAGLVTFAPDDIDWDDEIRIAFEERAAMSPDAMTGMEANLRFAGPETMETKIFARLSAWQNWIFQRPNAVGAKGALKVYGTGQKAGFDLNRV